MCSIPPNPVERNELVDRAFRLAYSYEAENRGCAQSVLAALQDILEMRDDGAFRSASGLSGGAGLTTHGSCGALSGGVMAIGMVFGRERSDFKDPDRRRMIAYRLASELCSRFEESYGSVICSEIQKRHLGRSFNLWSQRDYVEFDRVAYREGRCPKLVGQAAAWTVEIILAEIDRGGGTAPR
ncbi:MAG: C_GCAxxG_C_C family protein [Euryarchaeota archaeon]|nr:C_GCAxxG_C_C family protein [Euryarchaeota archaeon]